MFSFILGQYIIARVKRQSWKAPGKMAPWHCQQSFYVLCTSNCREGHIQAGGSLLFCLGWELWFRDWRDHWRKIHCQFFPVPVAVWSRKLWLKLHWTVIKSSYSTYHWLALMILNVLYWPLAIYILKWTKLGSEKGVELITTAMQHLNQCISKLENITCTSKTTEPVLGFKEGRHGTNTGTFIGGTVWTACDWFPLLEVQMNEKLTYSETTSELLKKDCTSWGSLGEQHHSKTAGIDAQWRASVCTVSVVWQLHSDPDKSTPKGCKHGTEDHWLLPA